MDDAALAVKYDCSQSGIAHGFAVKILGLDVVAAYVAAAPSPGAEAEAVRAWVSEMRHRTWSSPRALEADFADVRFQEDHVAVFHLAVAPLAIKTAICFRTGVVLVENIRRDERFETDSLVQRGTA